MNRGNTKPYIFKFPEWMPKSKYFDALSIWLNIKVKDISLLTDSEFTKLVNQFNKELKK